MKFKKSQFPSTIKTYFFKVATCIFFGITAGINVSLSSSSAVTIFSLAILFLFIKNCNKIFAQSFLVLCWTVGFVTASCYWIIIAIYDPILTPVSTACLVASSLFIAHALIYASSYYLINILIYTIYPNTCKNSNILVAIMSFSISFGIAEIVRSLGFWAMPWGMIGYTQTTNSLFSGVYPIAGSYVVTIITVLFSAILVLVFESISNQLSKNSTSGFLIYLINNSIHIVIAMTIVVILFLTKYIEWTREENNERLRARVVHTHIPNIQKYDVKVQQYSLQKIIDLSSLNDVDLTIYPELYLVKPAYGIEKQSRKQIVKAVIASKNSQLFGVPDNEVATSGTILGSLNVMLQIDEYGNTKRYAKEILLPFSEYMPTHPLLVWAMPYIFKFPLANFNSGELSNAIPLQIKNVKLAISICNEIAYPNNIHKHAANSQVLINSASDSWIPNQMYALHSWQISKVRAMEAQKPMLRSNNTGYSGYIDAWGKENAMEYEAEAIQKYEVTPRIGNTPYTNLVSFFNQI